MRGQLLSRVISQLRETAILLPYIRGPYVTPGRGEAERNLLGRGLGEGAGKEQGYGLSVHTFLRQVSPLHRLPQVGHTSPECVA